MRTFKTDLVSIFLTIILVSILSISVFSYIQTRDYTLKQSSMLIDQAIDSILQKASSFLEQAQVTSRLAASLVSDRESTPHDKDLERYMLTAMKSFPHFASMYYGDEAGNFMMVTRQKDQTLATKKIIHSGEQVIEEWTYRDAGNNVINTTSTEAGNGAYDARTRPWYSGAKERQASFWTDIYIFTTGKRPGITASYPVIGKQGTKGVVGVDILLLDLSEFLKTLQTTPNGIPFILNSKGKLIAYPEADKIIHLDAGGNAVTASAMDIGVPQIKQALQMFGDSSNNVRFEMGKETYMAQKASLPSRFSNDWEVVFVVPEDDFLSVINQTQREIMFITFLILIITIMIAYVVARSFSRPVEELTDQANKLKELSLDFDVEVKSKIDEVRKMQSAMHALRLALADFKKYVPEQLVRNLISSGKESKLGGVDAELTIFFSDIKGFTSISEQLEPQDLMVNLSEYLDVLTRIILEEGGTVDKYIGDSIMAFWGAPIPYEDHALRACRATFRCLLAIDKLNDEWEKQGRIKFPTRMGIHTGMTVVGNMGSSERMDYSAIGDSVNLASRLEGACNLYNSKAITSETTYLKAKEEFVFRPLDIIAVKGKVEGVKIFEMLADISDCPEEVKTMARDFTAAVELYRKRQWDEAISCFTALVEKYPDDQPSQMYLQRCKDFKENDPGENWDGIVRLTEK